MFRAARSYRFPDRSVTWPQSKKSTTLKYIVQYPESFNVELLDITEGNSTGRENVLEFIHFGLEVMKRIFFGHSKDINIRDVLSFSKPLVATTCIKLIAFEMTVRSGFS
jgi:hypothetical protein